MSNFTYNKLNVNILEFKECYTLEINTLAGLRAYKGCDVLELSKKYNGVYFGRTLYFKTEKSIKKLIEYLDSLVIVEIMKGTY